MKAKLVKKQEGWYNLYQNDIGIGSTHTELQGYKLSLANCQAIERGYDLDELAYGCDLYEKMNFVGQMRAFKAGFQKALELMSDKKFSEEDMINFSEFVSGKYINQYKFLRDKSLKGFFSTDEILKEYQSLQQTEWDVEIEMNFVGRGKHGVGSEVNHYLPKKDSNGCLILKI